MTRITINKRLGLSLNATAVGGRQFAGLFWKAWLRPSWRRRREGAHGLREAADDGRSQRRHRLTDRLPPGREGVHLSRPGGSFC